MKTLLTIIVLAAALVHEDPRSTLVGVTTKIEQLVLPGSELEVKPLDDRKLPVVLRILKVDQHGTAHRYDMLYYTLDPGTFDLRDYLRRKDGSSLGDVPEIKVTSKSMLPAGQVLPHEPAAGKPAYTGGYWIAVVAAGGLWLLGFLAILLLGRKKKSATMAVSAMGSTLADRLRPLVERGIAGKLELTERADLERALLAFWTKKLKLDSLKPTERFAALRTHADAGPLIVKLEAWLHEPEPEWDVDMVSLLRPYQNLPADILESLPETAGV